MAKKQSSSQESESRERLVVHVSKKEHQKISAAAFALGLKNAHQWATMKLASAIREVAR